MAINYTALLGLAQPVTGTEANTWGTVVNDEITALIEEAIAGGETINVTAGDVTLTDTDGVANQARNAILLVTGTPGTARSILAPNLSKVYIVRNGSDSTVTIKGVTGPTTGVAILSGQTALVIWNGSDFETVSSGDVDGPASSTDEAVARFNGTTGKLLQNSVVTITDAGIMGGITQLNVDNLRLDGNTISTTDSNGNLTITPNGTGTLEVTPNTNFNSTGAIKVPVGTGGQQPGTPAVGMLRYNSSTNLFAGYSGASPSLKSVGGASLSNDTSTASDLYPTFAAATTGVAENLYTSNARLLYKPSTGELKVNAPVASNGILVNNTTVNTSYTIASGSNGMSVGPMTVSSGVTVTVSSGQRWLVL